jgi:transcription antitermination factor NusG
VFLSCPWVRRTTGWNDMPILKREPDVFPDSLFDLEQPWVVAYLRSRQEKSFARYILHYQIPFYLPQIVKTTKRSGRTFTSHLPLFSGYVFMRADDAEVAQALRSHLVVNFLKPPDQPSFEEELKQIWMLQQSHKKLIPHPYIEPGDAVVITEGAFAGCRGIVVREKNEERLVVSVSFIRQSVAVEVDREYVRPEGERDRYSAVNG